MQSTFQMVMKIGILL